MKTNSFFRSFLLLWLHTLSKIVQVTCIEGPAYISGQIGDDAFFMWNRTDEGKILSVSWGIKKGNIADPQFINVNVHDNRVKKNQDLEEAFRKRTEFIGDLHKGHAWFKLKNLTVTDTNEYIASISDNVTSVLPYFVRLEVKEKRVKPTGGSSSTTTKPTEGSTRTTKTPTADYDQTAANNTEPSAAVNTTATKPNNTVSDHTLMISLVCLFVALFVTVFIIMYLKRKKSNQQGKENQSQKEDSSSL